MTQLQHTMCENILGMIVASKPNLVDSNLCIVVSKPNLVDSNLHFIVSKPNLGRYRKRACVVTMHKEHICTCYTHTHSFQLLSICGYGNIVSAKTETTVVEYLVVCGQCARDG